MVVTEFVDDQEIRSYQATLGEEETIELSREMWLTLTNGAHQLRVEAVDGNFATSVRVWNFSKKETVIKFQFAKPEETDARATKILITPTWKIEGSVAKVEACNNAFDAAPTWEDITAQVAINRVSTSRTRPRPPRSGASTFVSPSRRMRGMRERFRSPGLEVHTNDAVFNTEEVRQGNLGRSKAE